MTKKTVQAEVPRESRSSTNDWGDQGYGSYGKRFSWPLSIPSWKKKAIPEKVHTNKRAKRGETKKEVLKSKQQRRFKMRIKIGGGKGGKKGEPY